MAVGLGLSFVGYWLAYFGYCSIKGPGVGLIDLIVPGRTITIPTSSGGTQNQIGPPGTGAAGGYTVPNPTIPGGNTAPAPGKSTGETRGVPPDYTGPIPGDPGAQQN